MTWTNYGGLVQVVCTAGLLVVLAEARYRNHVFTNDFLVHADGSEAAHRIAKRHGLQVVRSVLGSDSEWHMKDHALPHARTKRSLYKHRTIRSDPEVKFVTQQIGYRRLKRGYRPLEEKLKALEFKSLNSPSDPLYPYQWYLKNTGQGGGKPRLDLNVETAWALGYTGKNVTTAIMDDGVDYMHPDLINNFVSFL
jgi:proprotein convertase subtilisin/kexin type 2